MGLKQENFVDRVYVTTTLTGLPATGLTLTCYLLDESDNRSAGTVAEIGNGWYKISDFTPDADGTWCTEWATAAPTTYTIHYPYKEFKVGGGQEVDTQGSGFDTSTDSLVKLHDEHLTYIYAASDTGTTHDITTANDTVETQVFEVAKAGIYALSVWLDLDALETAAEGGTVTVKLYNKIDGSNYSDTPSGYVEYIVGSDNEYPSFEVDMIHEYCKLTIQCSTDVTATRAIAYRYITQDLGA